MATMSLGELVDAVESRLGKEAAPPEEYSLKNYVLDALRWLLPLAPESATSSVHEVGSATRPPVSLPTGCLKVIGVKHEDGRLARLVTPTEFQQYRGLYSADVQDPGAQEHTSREDFFLQEPDIVLNDGSVYVCRKTHTAAVGNEPGNNAGTWGDYWWGPFPSDDEYDAWAASHDAYTGAGEHQGVGGPSSRLYTEFEGAIHVYRMMCTTDRIYLTYLVAPTWGADAAVIRKNGTRSFQLIRAHDSGEAAIAPAANESPNGTHSGGDNWAIFWKETTYAAGHDAWAENTDYGDVDDITIPNGWEGVLADYCAAQACRENHQMSQKHMTNMKNGLTRFGVFLDQPESVGG